MVFLDDDDAIEDSAEEAIRLLEEQRELLIAVATGGPRIENVDAEYRKRRRVLMRHLKALRVKDPIPWPDLWRWYAFYSSKLGTYHERRTYISDLVDPTLDALERLQRHPEAEDWGDPDESPESWVGLESRVDGLRDELREARTPDDFQDVGRRCREVVIDLANLVFEEEMVDDGDDLPSRNDSKARINYFLGATLSGETNSTFRRFVRAAYDLMQEVTHSSSVGRAEAFAAAQATLLLVRTLHTIQLEEEESEDE